MINIDKVKDEIVERLLPLRPQKIILFGSYAAGTATDESDIDLFLVNNELGAGDREYEVNAMLKLRDLIRKYKTGFDILSASQEFLSDREEYFYKVDILKNGKVIYAE
jgi:uncharacterized protein